jgi:hypothetical protein
MHIDLRHDDAVMLRDLLRERIRELDKEINRTDHLDFKHDLQQLERTIERIIGQLSAAIDRPAGIEPPTAQQ